MATVQSSSSAQTSGTTLNVNAPTGLAVGDLLVSFIKKRSAGTISTIPTGFNLFDSGTGNDNDIYAYTKIADSADVAAGVFTWTFSGSNFNAGIALRITGYNPNQLVFESNFATVLNTANPSFANGLAAFPVNGLILNVVSGAGVDNGANTFTYAIATSNPTWTQAQKERGGLNTEEILAVAYATRTQTTATGNSSVSGTFGDASTDWGGLLVGIGNDNSVTISESVSLTETIIALKELFTTVLDTVGLTETVIADAFRPWTNLTKNLSTWINPDK